MVKFLVVTLHVSVIVRCSVTLFLTCVTYASLRLTRSSFRTFGSLVPCVPVGLGWGALRSFRGAAVFRGDCPCYLWEGRERGDLETRSGSEEKGTLLVASSPPTLGVRFPQASFTGRSASLPSLMGPVISSLESDPLAFTGETRSHRPEVRGLKGPGRGDSVSRALRRLTDLIARVLSCQVDGLGFMGHKVLGHLM